MSDKLKFLVGREVVGLMMSENKETLLLQMGDGTVEILNAVGDCCSHSWIEHISGVQYLVGRRSYGSPRNPIVSVEEVETVEEKKNDYDLIQIYGHKITTTRGVCTIEMRNESNGFYCGWFERGLIGQYGSFENQDLSMKAVVADF